jgi:transcriptional regulator with XRE-family HTH domain
MSTSQTLSILDLQLLHQLGDRLQRLRKERGVGTVELAERVGISRPTLRAVESGDPNTSIGTYLRVMSALGISGELAMLASDVLSPAASNTAAGRSRRPRPAVRVTVSTDRSSSDLHDLQSLALHAAGIELVKRDDHMRARALATVDNWLRSDPKSRSAPLWLEWRRILTEKAYRAVLGRSSRSQQLRQASPIPTLLPNEARLAILEQFIELKDGLTFDGEAKAAET